MSSIVDDDCFSEDTLIDILDFTANNKLDKMTTKLNHKNGDKTLQEDLLSDKQEKIGQSEFDKCTQSSYFVKTLILMCPHWHCSV